LRKHGATLATAGMLRCTTRTVLLNVVCSLRWFTNANDMFKVFILCLSLSTVEQIMSRERNNSSLYRQTARHCKQLYFFSSSLTQLCSTLLTYFTYFTYLLTYLLTLFSYFIYLHTYFTYLLTYLLSYVGYLFTLLFIPRNFKINNVPVLLWLSQTQIRRQMHPFIYSHRFLLLPYSYRRCQFFADTAHFTGILRIRQILLTQHILLIRPTTKFVLKNSLSLRTRVANLVCVCVFINKRKTQIVFVLVVFSTSGLI